MPALRDHVYHKCREEYKQDIQFLFEVLKNLRSNKLKTIAAGKVYNDFYAWAARERTGSYSNEL